MVTVIPHTSNWDFPMGILSRKSIGQDIKFIAKSSLFKWPIGWLFRWLGGYPVDRSGKHNFVDTIVDIFNQKETFITTLSPEGTRSKVDKLKTGFYYIAKGANIPLVLCRFDWEHKIISFSEPFFTTDDKEADFKFIDNHFLGIKGKNPEKGYMYEG